MKKCPCPRRLRWCRRRYAVSRGDLCISANRVGAQPRSASADRSNRITTTGAPPRGATRSSMHRPMRLTRAGERRKTADRGRDHRIEQGTYQTCTGGRFRWIIFAFIPISYLCRILPKSKNSLLKNMCDSFDRTAGSGTSYTR